MIQLLSLLLLQVLQGYASGLAQSAGPCTQLDERASRDYMLSKQICQAHHASIVFAGETQAYNDSQRMERPHDPDALPGGCYDALGTPISEEEYLRQAEYEQRTGLPFVRDRESERSRKDLPLSVKVFSDCSCGGEHDAHITSPSVCVAIENGRSVFVESMSSLCAIASFDDNACTTGTYEFVQGLGGVAGCYSLIDSLGSISVTCAAGLPA